MSEPFIGEIRLFAGTFAPQGWAFCDGQLLPISENDALFSLIGTTYGGDGQFTFALPDLRGRAPLHAGEGLDLPTSAPGDIAGADPAPVPETTSVANGVSIDRGIASSTGTTRVASATGPQHPTLAIHFIIALFGMFPSST